VLRCSACRNLGFTEVGALGNTNSCTRCGNSTPLTLEAWRQPIADPEWYYELHPIVRDLVRENGHAPLWLAHHIRQGARTYSDIPETNLFVGMSHRPTAEADLVAHVDGRLLIAEVKTTDELDASGAKRKAAAHKRVMWARLVNADEIVLATTSSTWQQSSVEAMRAAMREAAKADVWLPGGTPRLWLVHNLGSTVTEEIIDPY
jgi:Holliday junction resolvase-like predicted endonuclease